MTPVVGYHGGKRRLLSRIRPALPAPDSIHRYVEPFVGMGAVYLDLRKRGYVGPALLADANEVVADFWRIVHTRGRELVDAAEGLNATMDPDVYFAVLAEDEPDVIARCAKFLWITNYSYANVAPVYRGGGKGWSGSGCKLTSAAKWGKTFPWDRCVARLKTVCSALDGMDVEVLDDVSEYVSRPGDVVYADPPYFGRRGYAPAGNANREKTDYAPTVFGWRSRCVVLSETRELSVPDGWECSSGEVTARASRRHDKGSVGRRSEWLYIWRTEEKSKGQDGDDGDDG